MFHVRDGSLISTVLSFDLDTYIHIRIIYICICASVELGEIFICKNQGKVCFTVIITLIQH